MLHEYIQADAHENDLLRVRDEIEKYRCDEMTCLLLFFACAGVAIMNLQWENFGFSWSFLILSLASLAFLGIFFKTKKRPRYLADKKFAEEFFPAIIVNGKEIEFLRMKDDTSTLTVKIDHGGYSVKLVDKTNAMVCRGSLERPGIKYLAGPFWEIVFPNEPSAGLLIREATLKIYIDSGAITWIQ
jgi:hypothetical protein